MSSEIIVAWVAAAAAVLSAIFAYLSQVRVARLTASHNRAERQEAKRDEVERVVTRFREPLVRAAYDLQSRLYNISAQGLLDVYLVHGTDEEREYVVNNTLFLVAQYFGWNEIIRREVQFLDLGDQAQTRHLSELHDTITHLWLTDGYGSKFRVFAGDQRAIGERMIRETQRGLECVGYADFMDTVQQQPNRIPYLSPLGKDLFELADAPSSQHPRLVALQNALVDLLGFLDPDYLRYPRERRLKLRKPSGV